MGPRPLGPKEIDGLLVQSFLFTYCVLKPLKFELAQERKVVQVIHPYI